MHAPVRFFGRGRITVGTRSVVNRGCYLDNRGEIEIGNNVSIAHDVKIYTGGHDIDSPAFTFFKKGVKIDDFVVIFSNAIIQPGVHLKKGSVVLPGAVVTRGTDEFDVVGGNPAKVVRRRAKELNYSCEFGLWFAP